jgi:hypothetical protein
VREADGFFTRALALYSSGSGNWGCLNPYELEKEKRFG